MFLRPKSKTIRPAARPGRPGGGIRCELEQHAIRLGLVREGSLWRRRSRQRTLRAIARLAAATAAARRVAMLGMLAILLPGLLGSGTAQAQDGNSATTLQDSLAWGLQMMNPARPSSSITQLALNTEIDVEVSGLTARVYVVQDFRNDGLDWVEAVYRFPLPDGPAVDKLFIKAGERLLEGEIRERLDAERVYQQARAEGKAAGLVQQERVNQFSTRLANIGPGEDIQVMIGFLVKVQWLDDHFSLRLPLTFNQRYDPPGTERPAEPRPMLVAAAQRPQAGLKIQVELPGDTTLTRIESHYHDIDIQGLPAGYRVHLAAEDELPNKDFELNWYPQLGSSPQASLSTFDDGTAVYAQLMLIPPLPEALQDQPREVIFIIDTSGSMEGDSLTQARDTLLRGISQLEAGDSFNLVQFNSRSESLFKQPVEASADNQQRAERYVRRLQAQGGTDMAPALHLALSQPARDDRLRQVIFITDGGVSNEAELLAQIARELGQARLFPVAIGSAPNSRFMRKAAEIGRGSHTHIASPQDVAERMDALWLRIRQPALTDICIDWGMQAEFYPELIPDLYAGQPLWLNARLPAEPSSISLCGQLGDQAWWQDVRPLHGQGSATLATLWAGSKLEALQDGLMFGADPERTREQMTFVALDYGLLSAHTSMVAVDKTPIRAPSRTLHTQQVPSLLPAGASVHAAAFPATATGWKAQLALSLLVLLISGRLLLYPGVRPHGQAA
jgi:Ca-activated chloride channel family protein